MAKRKSKDMGQWAFMLGVILAILTGLVGSLIPAATVAMVLVVLGVLVGLMNVSGKEVTDFLIAAIALLLTGAAGLDALPAIGSFIGPILTNIATFVAPAVVIVALRAVYELAQ